MSDYYTSDESDDEPCLHLKEQVRQGNYNAVRIALEKGADPNDSDQDSGDYTLLHWAAGLTDEDNLREVGACKGTTMTVRKRIVELLLERRADPWCIWWKQCFSSTHGQRPWNLTGDSDTVYLIQRICLSRAVERIREGKANELSYQVKSGSLVAASALNDPDVIRDLYRAGADVDDDSCDITALGVASARGNLEAVLALLDDCHASDPSALEIAAGNGRHAIVQVLLDKGADPFRETEYGHHVAFVADGADVLDTILTHMHMGIQVVVDRIGKEDLESRMAAATREATLFKVAFHVFIACGYSEGIRTLLRVGLQAPPNALQTAVSFGQIDTLEFLLAEGALRTYNAEEMVHYYGRGDRRPRRTVVLECQRRLTETIAASDRWAQLARDTD